MGHIHSVYDSDMHFSINPVTRAIQNESPKNSLVQYDHNSERFTFELPRYIEEHDMSHCNRVEVHYINIGRSGDQKAGVYEVDDCQISRRDNGVVICSWLISSNATQYAGSLAFLIRFACVAADGTIEYAWHTEVNKGIAVTDGMSNGEAIVEEYADVLEQWKNAINGAGYITLADTVSVYEFADYDNFHLGVLGGYVDMSLLPVGKRVRIKNTNIPLLYVSGQPTSGYGDIPDTEQDFITMLNNTGEVSYYGIALRDYAKDSGMVSGGGGGTATNVPTKVSELANDAGYLTTAHNASTTAHNDIRQLISGLTSRLNAVANSDDTTLDQLSEIVAYIKANKSLIDSITTSKVNVSDIIDNLTTSVSNKPLSAKMGVELKKLIDAIKIPTTLPASDVYSWAKQPTKPTYTAAEVGAATPAYVDSKIEEIVDKSLPSYWQSHIDEKIATVKALQDEGGKDCFSFVAMADMHYPTNLGKCSPLLAKKILDGCDIKYALVLGDTQTRGCHATKELLLAENVEIEKMLSPIRDRLLQTEGNHDGSYGTLDKDGDGEISNYDSDGNLKAPAERETYVYNLTPAELHSAIYRKVGLVGDVHFDESGSGYYVDDTANKVRYIVLNTHCNDYELQEDGTVKYPKMWIFRFTQPQLDLVEEALNTIPSDSWGVVVAGHCPLWQEIGDSEVMQGVLNAYKNKTTYSGSYVGTASGGAVYTNLADPTSADWKNGYRIGSSALSAQAGKTTTNLIECAVGDVIRVKGVEFEASVDRVCMTMDNTQTGQYNYVSELPNDRFGYEKVNGVHTFTILKVGIADYKYFRFCFDTPTDPSTVIITKNEEITEGTVGGYDAVSVDCDFSNAKGQLIGYFAGHVHADRNLVMGGVPVISTRCDACEEYTEEMRNERVKGTITEQSFDVFTVNKAKRKIYATKIGAGDDRVIDY